MEEPLGVSIGNYHARKSGRGLTLQLPQVWVDEEGIEGTDLIEQRRLGHYLILRHVKRTQL